MNTTGYHYTVARIWDAGGDWDDAPSGEYASVSGAIQAAENYVELKRGEGGGDTRVTIATSTAAGPIWTFSIS